MSKVVLKSLFWAKFYKGIVYSKKFIILKIKINFKFKMIIEKKVIIINLILSKFVLLIKKATYLLISK